MKIPKSFHIKGKEWVVEYKWGLRDEGIFCDGLCDFETRTIYLRRETPADSKFKVFLHELTHAIVHECHLHEDGGLDGILEEVLCEGMADVLTTLFAMRFKRGTK